MKFLKGLFLFFKSFAYSKGKPQPSYVYICIFLALIIRILWLRTRPLNGELQISDGLILGLCGFVLAWIGVFNWFTTNDRRKETKWEGPDRRKDTGEGDAE
jgi:hypothetical protein